MGDFQYFVSHMSQPKFQLETFKAWAGKSSDISYYLNSHHIDLHCWAMEGKAKPRRVSATAATGVATGKGIPAEDLITLMVEWENNSGNKGVAVYTSGWAAPNYGEVHSQQRFLCIGSEGEVRADQAHRGYDVHYDNLYKTLNPLYMKYTPDDEGYFAGVIAVLPNRLHGPAFGMISNSSHAPRHP
jgi:D-galacturonate reductase